MLQRPNLQLRFHRSRFKHLRQQFARKKVRLDPIQEWESNRSKVGMQGAQQQESQSRFVVALSLPLLLLYVPV